MYFLRPWAPLHESPIKWARVLSPPTVLTRPNMTQVTKVLVFGNLNKLSC